MDTEGGEMSEYHSQTEDEATISSILGTVFSVEKGETSSTKKGGEAKSTTS